MQDPNELTCVAEDGSRYVMRTVSSNEDLVANLIAEGHINPEDRWREVAALYRKQRAAENARRARLVAYLLDDMRRKLGPVLEAKCKTSTP